MPKKTIVNYKLGTYRTLPILEKTKNPYSVFNNSDSKKIYDLVSDAVFALKKINKENEKVRLQRFCWLLCEEIKSNFKELFGDKKLTKNFREAISKKISKTLKAENIEDSVLFTESDVADAIDSAIEKISKEGFIDKYLNVLSPKETEKVMAKFSKEFYQDPSTQKSIDNLFKNPEKNVNVLTSISKKLVASTGTATKMQEKINKLTSDIESQTKKKEETEKKKEESSSAEVPAQEQLPPEPTPSERKDGKSIFGRLFRFAGLGVTAATAAKLTSTFDYDRQKKESEKKADTLWGHMKKKMSYDFHKTTFRITRVFNNLLTSTKEFGKKTLGFTKNLLKYSAAGIMKLILSPFTLIYSRLKKVFHREEGSVQANVKTFFRKIFFSASFFFFLGMVFGLIYKIIVTGIKKFKEFIDSMQTKIHDFSEWADNFKKNWKEILSEKAKKAWEWIKSPDTWRGFGDTFSKLLSKIFPEDIMSSLKQMGELIADKWNEVQDMISSGPIRWIIDIFETLQSFIKFVGTTKFGTTILSITGAAWKTVPTFIGKIISLGLGIMAAILPAAIVKLFTGWNDDDTAYDLDEDYRKSLGVDRKTFGRNLTLQITDDTASEVVAATNNMIQRNTTAGTEISRWLGGENYKGSLGYLKNRLKERGFDSSFRKNFKPEALQKYFSFNFLTDDEDTLKPMAELSEKLFTHFMTNPALESLDDQFKFLQNLTTLRKEFLLFNSALMENISLDSFTSLRKNKENYINPLSKIVNDYFSQYKKDFNFPMTDLHSRLYTISQDLYKLYPVFSRRQNNNFGSLLLQRGSLKYINKNGKEVLVVGMGTHDLPDEYIYGSLSPTTAGYSYNKPYETARFSQTVFPGLPPVIEQNKIYSIALNQQKAFEYLVDSMADTNEIIRDLQNNPKELDYYTWEQLAYLLAGRGSSLGGMTPTTGMYNTQMDDALSKTKPSEGYMYSLLWRIFDAAREAGDIE